MASQVYIIGGGDTGLAVARALMLRGCAITIGDRDPEQVTRLRSEGLNAMEVDVISEGTLVRSGALTADLVVVATGKSVQAGIYATMLLKHLGAPRVAACAENLKCADLLGRIGARVFFPKRESPERLADELCSELPQR